MISKRAMFRLSDLYPNPHYLRTTETLAIHEAAHFVIQKYVGLIPKKTAINRKRGGGVAEYDIFPSESTKEPQEVSFEAKQEAVCIMAAVYQGGLIGERIYAGHEVNGFILSDSSDFKVSAKLLRMVGLPLASAYPDLLAKKILHNNWQLVEKVSEELLAKGYINWDFSKLQDIDALFLGADDLV